MPHLSHHRGSAHSTTVVIGALAVLVAITVVSIICFMRYGGEQYQAVIDSSRTTTRDVGRAADLAAAQAFDSSMVCSAQRKVAPGANDRVEDYFTSYLLCIQPSLASDAQQLRNRLEYLKTKLREEFPDGDLPPGSSFRIIGDAGLESMYKYAGEKSAVP